MTTLASRIRHPAMHKLLGRWQSSAAVAGTSRLPDAASLALDDPEIADWVFAFDLVDIDPPTLVRSHVGAALVALHDLTTGLEVNVVLDNEEDPLLGAPGSYRRSLRLRVPVHEYLRLTTGIGQTTTMERLLLPCQDFGSAAHQLVGMVFFATDEPAESIRVALDDMSEEEIDSLPYGVVKLDRQGRVQRYSRTEMKLSRYSKGSPLGLEFFTRVAPCMNTARIRGRIEQGIQDGVFEAEFTHVGDFSDAERLMTIRAFSARDGGAWMTLTR